MNEKMQRLDRVAGWLDKVVRLPIGHPDRLRFLTRAEQILEGQTPAGKPILISAEGTPVLSGSDVSV
jgi:hypothetical protein